MRILVADDERDTREFLQELLTRLGHEVRAAEDGRRLVELSRDFAPDLIITDYAMPGVDGLAAVAAIHQERPIPVILVSGRHEVEVPAQAAGSPVVRLLVKPFKPADLKAAIAAVAGAAPAPDGPG